MYVVILSLTPIRNTQTETSVTLQNKSSLIIYFIFADIFIQKYSINPTDIFEASGCVFEASLRTSKIDTFLLEIKGVATADFSS